MAKPYYPMILIPANLKLVQSFSESTKKKAISLQIQQKFSVYPTVSVIRLKKCMDITWLFWIVVSLLFYVFALYRILSLASLGLSLLIVFSVFVLSWSYFQQYKCRLLKKHEIELNNYTQSRQIIEGSVSIEKAETIETLKLDLKPEVFSVGRGDTRCGMSEKTFKVYLERYFNVEQSLAFKVTEEYNYTADFLVSHIASGLCIDVEIDEPYALQNAEPTHCSDCFADYKRNKWFNDRGYVVVRFSEYQVVTQPDSCCFVIAKAIADYTGDVTILNHFQGIPKLIPQYAWNIKEAKTMAKKQYRSIYLPSAIIVKSRKMLTKKKR